MKLKDLYEKSRENQPIIGIGAGSEREGYTKKVIESVKKVDFAKVLIFGEKVNTSRADFIETNDPSKTLVKFLKENKLDVAVRGSLSAKKVLSFLKEFFKTKEFYRTAFLETKYPVNKLFFLAPVGIDEGKNVEEKQTIVEESDYLFKRFDLKKKIAVLSGGRIEDKGRSKAVDESLKQARELTKNLEDKNREVKNYSILIEDAIKESDYLVAPDGIIGNYIFRTLTFLGGGKAIGAPILNLKRPFVDTSRASKSYFDSLAFASALAKD